MSKEADAAEREALHAELAVIADELEVAQATVASRFERRLVVFKRLLKLGSTQVEIAASSKVTPMAVGYALAQDRKKADARRAKRSRRPAT